MPSPMPQYNLLGKGDAPTKLSDFEGMRVRALGGVGNAMKTIGAVPTTVTAAEAYQAIDSGTVQAVAFAPHAHLSFKTIEAGSWWTNNLNPGTVSCPVVVSKDAYDMLSPDFQKALDESVAPAIQHYLDTYAKVYDKFYPALEENGVEQITFSEEELASFKAAAGKPVWDKWLKTCLQRASRLQTCSHWFKTQLLASNCFGKGASNSDVPLPVPVNTIRRKISLRACSTAIWAGRVQRLS